MSVRSSVLSASVLAAALSSTSSAAILTFTNEFLYNANTTSYTRSSENFDSYSGAYGSLNGAAGAVNWSAGATGGLNVAAGRLAAAAPNALTISFSGPDVYGVSGNFFGTDASNTVVPSLVLVALSDGTSYLNLIDTATVFVGFVSTGAAITSIQVTAQPFPTGSPSVFATVDNLGVAYVPAPGALALLGLAGLAGRRRR
jgi:hypothetical protein